MDDDKEKLIEQMSINATEIDADWLQRKVAVSFEQPRQTALAEKIFQILADNGNNTIVENNLLLLLKADQIDLIKILMWNRFKIVWCTRLARSRDQEEREKIEEKMKGLDLQPILEELHGGRVSANKGNRNWEEAPSRGEENARRNVMLDLDRPTFELIGCSMAKKEYKLPDECYRNHFNEYEEIHVPLMAKFIGPHPEFVKACNMPGWAQPAFEGITQLNRVESMVYKTALSESDNLLICAPTDVGKTNIAILTILHQIKRHLDTGGGSNGNKAYKIVYMITTKAVVDEVVGNLSSRLKKYNVEVRELIEDQFLTEQQMKEPQVIVTIPEKWEAITRKPENKIYTQHVKLLIIDEVHLLYDNRGSVLESIIARTLRQVETTKDCIRLVGLSATFPNYRDVAQFLCVDLNKGLFYFDNSYRLVPLSQQYFGIKVQNPLERFHLMNKICCKKVEAMAGKHQVIIFVYSSKEAVEIARAIKDDALASDTLCRFFKEDSPYCKILCSDLVNSNDLRDLLPCGIAIHHTDMSRTDSKLVKDLFACGHLQVLISTRTLALGVNLLAHTVIIKGTQIYNPEKGAWTELSPLDMMRMWGLAGRPQYDSYGEGIIITGHSELQYYVSLLNEKLPIESRFMSKLADNLNAEIVLGNIQNHCNACDWIGSTYLGVRMSVNPSVYGVTQDQLVKMPTDLINTGALMLERTKLVKYDKETGYFEPTELGHIASHHNITPTTISRYDMDLKPTMGDIDLCRLFSMSEEFKYVTVRHDEQMELAKLLRLVEEHIPIKESLEKPSGKIIILLQAIILKLELEGLSLPLTLDVDFITQRARSLLPALFKLALKRGWAQLAEKALNLSNNVVNNTLLKFIQKAPKLNLDADLRPITRTVLQFEVKITPDFAWDDEVHGNIEYFLVMLVDDDRILHHQYFMLKKEYIGVVHSLNFKVEIYKPLPPEYRICVVSHRWPGCQTLICIPSGQLILPYDNYPGQAATELFDEQLLPVTELGNPLYEALYQDFENFNRVQTQVFSVLYNSDDNVLVAAPPGSGKTVCAEFSVLRNDKKGFHALMRRVVYIAAVEVLVTERYCDWKKFEASLGMRVVKLTGDIRIDRTLIEQGDIIISTPERWDALSRHWIEYPFVSKVGLFIVDDLHLLGGHGGHVLEVCVSRMRTISSCVNNKIRIVALSTSVANARDLGEWIGAPSDGIFYFPPAIRPTALDIIVQEEGVYMKNFDARIQEMVETCYTTIAQHAKNGKPVLVFVPTRKHIQLVVEKFIKYSGAHSEEMPEIFENINDDMLKAALRQGIGYLHESMSRIDRDTVAQLFKFGCFQVCVLSSSMCWSISLLGQLVVVMGTQYFDGPYNAQTDYTITDLLQMTGHLVDSRGKCIVLCQAPCKEYYKKFLLEPLVIESRLLDLEALKDNINSEIFFGTVGTEQEAIETFLARTFMYQRQTQNPSFYHFPRPIYALDHLKNKVHSIVTDLAEGVFVDIGADGTLTSLPLGEIASQCCISCKTVEMFQLVLSPQTTMGELLQLLCCASEFERVPTRYGEEEMVRRLINSQRFTFENVDPTQYWVKASALLQAHFSRRSVCGNFVWYQNEVLLLAHELLEAMLLIVCHADWFGQFRLVAQVMQMVTQGIWEYNSMLLQLPHFTNNLVRKCREDAGIETILDLSRMEDHERAQLLNISDSEKLEDIAEFIKCFPDISLSFEVLDRDNVRVGEDITVQVTLERNLRGEREVGHAVATRFPRAKTELWWLVVGDEETDLLHCVQRVNLAEELEVNLEFAAPAEAGEKSYSIHFLSDSYKGYDQNYDFTVDVMEAGGD